MTKIEGIHLMKILQVGVKEDMKILCLSEGDTQVLRFQTSTDTDCGLKAK